MAKQYNIPNLPKDYSDASQIEKWMSGIQKLFQSKNDADNKKEIEIENSINRSACTEDAVKDILNASGSAPIYACRAWVNFNGITNVINGSGNISSLTDNGTGQWYVNFTTNLEDSNYSVTLSSDAYANGRYACNPIYEKSTSRFRFVHFEEGTGYDTTSLCAAIFR